MLFMMAEFATGVAGGRRSIGRLISRVDVALRQPAFWNEGGTYGSLPKPPVACCGANFKLGSPVIALMPPFPGPFDDIGATRRSYN
jgi:hypothetical protein